MSAIECAIKRGIDISACLLAITVLSPVYLLIALLIKLDTRGPALFSQKRLGKQARPFECYKFRTMLVGSPDLRNVDGSTFNSEDDPRVTRVGRALRKMSLDELPQLFNVIKGEMSLVGPRPDQVDQLKLYTQRELLRLTVRPGLTGLAQINGRNSIPWEERKRLDLDYIERRSLSLDISLLLRTIPYVLIRRDVFGKQPSETDDYIPG
jgi:undecaprenyl phosphate N,N'-diacetylbacillosamine 1-phosphate transferase